ncbi:conserved hypothetical protein [Rippkaea orientalis PCC 8801]|uniref:Type IV pilin PilA n=1 Tax=Rippkaea orientalis (strain PCC 8801 / RF-1) TaxID=41431 RepID=B7JVX6_RIPO1|nr:hypothetical protein [Rippkaea orientalis]ACK65665.1 conserved hypothetical protein [Rippkaea orientalis PCC 8801]
MSVKSSEYETLLCEYSDRLGAIALLKQHRPYLEMIPSLRRPEASLITIPLPVVKVRRPQLSNKQQLTVPSVQETIHVPCDVAIVMCDPEWKIKLGSEILVFIHRPHEDFSHLLNRWRNCQVYLSQDYEWLMPPHEDHMLSEGADSIHPLFVLFEKTPHRIRKGLTGAFLPYIIPSFMPEDTQETPEMISD